MAYRHFNTTIMFCDMKGFTSRTAASSRKELQKTLDEYENLVFPIFSRWSGKVIKGLGDAYLVSFSSPTNAVLCGIEIQNQISERNKKVPKKERFTARIGITSGEVYERGGDIFGEPVNLASRVQSVAKGGQVAFSESTYQAMNKNEISYSFIGKYKLKGIKEKTKIYLAREKGKKARLMRARAFVSRNKKWFILGFLFILFLIIVSNSIPKEVGEKWNQKAYEALESGNMRDIPKLIEAYENSPGNLKGFEERVLAARLYAAVGDMDQALSELRSALKIADEKQADMIYQLARERGIELSR